MHIFHYFMENITSFNSISNSLSKNLIIFNLASVFKFVSKYIFSDILIPFLNLYTSLDLILSIKSLLYG